MVKRMKTTMNLDEELLRATKRLAAERGVTVTSIVEDALRHALDAARDHPPYVFEPTIVHGRRPPAVDVSDREALYDLLDSE